jgi:hypothetical protein
MKKALLSVLSLVVFASPVWAYPSFECVGSKSGNYYSASIADVGDEEGEIAVNNGGAPQYFRAHYREVSEGVHTWLFGYELYDTGIVPVLSDLKLKVDAAGKVTGKVSYFEHDASSQSHQLIKEKVTCEVL